MLRPPNTAQGELPWAVLTQPDATCLDDVQIEFCESEALANEIAEDYLTDAATSQRPITVFVFQTLRRGCLNSKGELT